MVDRDTSQELVEKVKRCLAKKTAVNIRGQKTKSFLGHIRPAPELDVSTHRGVVNYEPTELVLTARCGTQISELEQLLEENGQMLAFEPPVFNAKDTIGGVVATGVSGPRRAYAGSVRDFVLGVRVINGKAEQLRFGGEVMKNVAGYDVSRLQVGAMGTLGVILEVSLKVLPKPQSECTLLLENERALDVSPLLSLARQSLPISATAVLDKQCWIRLSGSEHSVTAAAQKIGGEQIADGASLWYSLRTLSHEFFNKEQPLWRIALPPHVEKLNLRGDFLYDWGGGQRWLFSDESAEKIFAEAAAFGGHATCYRGAAPGAPVFQPLSGTLKKLNHRLKMAFDPDGIFNPGRLHAEH